MSEKLYLVEHLLGVLLVDEKENILAKSFRMRDVDQLVEEIIKRRSGEVDDALKKIIDEIKEKYRSYTIVVEDHELSRVLSEDKLSTSVEPLSDIFVKFRSKILNLYISEGLFKNIDEVREFIHRVSIELTRRDIRAVAGKRDLLAIQSIRAIDDIDKTLNLFAARLREWYSIHFPELDELVDDHMKYAQIVYSITSRENMSIEKLTEIGVSESLAKKIHSAAQKSMGSEVSDADLNSMRSLAEIILQLYRLREDLTNYLSSVMREVAPNITALVGPTLGARLLSLAGSLEELAKSPASTIQVLGAEKALFRALRTGGKPPKHGVIFQYPEIHRAPRWQRGKIARALATKLAIAARVDFYTGRYIGDKLVESLKQRIEEIKKVYAKPPPREEKPRPKPKPKEKKSEKK
ncbi:MAG: C/D box methylation guide ribonucleoprotein complex aNOP56 subunit [Sulfolobales archaeon]